jgi:predicted 3-demethylubiquinone-9 3-methyltransferase (glyoxalase superfamily)
MSSPASTGLYREPYPDREDALSTITPHLWFDTQAKEAAEFYCALFPDSEVTDVRTLHDTPSGDCDIVAFRLLGQEFMAISAGPLFKINPSISFIVNLDPSRDDAAEDVLDRLWAGLTESGTTLMPLDEYPFSKKYGWVQDGYGVSWQLMLSDPAGDPRPAVVPSLMFAGDVSGKAEEAVDFYLSVFGDAERGQLVRYPEGLAPELPGTVMFSDFRLADTWFAAMDGGRQHAFGFNEAVSLLINCADQAEIDRYWERLSAVPAAEQCGWLKDRYGVSWQVAPAVMRQMLANGTPEQVARVTQAFLPMKKFDLAALRAAYDGEG